MSAALDVLLLAGVSAAYAYDQLFLGVVILVLGLFFQAQARRTRLLIGSRDVPAGAAKRIRAGLLSLFLAAMAVPLALEGQGAQPAFEKSSSADAFLPILIVMGILSAMLMIGLSVERRRR